MDKHVESHVGYYPTRLLAERKACLVGLALRCVVALVQRANGWHVWAIGINAQNVIFLAERFDPSMQGADAIDATTLCEPILVIVAGYGEELQKRSTWPAKPNPFVPEWWLDEIPF